MKYLKEWGRGGGDGDGDGDGSTCRPAEKLNENRLASISNARDSRTGNHLCGGWDSFPP